VGLSAQELLERARSYASQDRHREAIRFYLAAVEADSSLRGEVAVEIGHQYTWADRPDSALPWYRLYLRSHPGDREALLGLARALSWTDRLGEAERIYEKLSDAGDLEALVGRARVVSWDDRLVAAEKLYRKALARDPGNREALLGLAQVINWGGWHREAEGRYREFLASHPGDAEALVGLAAALAWKGDLPGAFATLQKAAGAREAVKFERELKASRLPRLSSRIDHTYDSDRIQVDAWQLRLGYPLGYSTNLAPFLGVDRIDQPGFAALMGLRAGVEFHRRFAPAVALTAVPVLREFRYGADRAPGGSPTRIDELLWDSYLTLTPSDAVRIDVGCAREYFAIPISILKRIRATSLAAGLDWRLSRTLTLVSSARETFLSDENRRFAAAQELRWKPDPARGLHILQAFGYEYLDFSKTLDNGYYNPPSYLSLFEQTRLEKTLRRRIGLSARLRLSLDREGGGGWIVVGAFGGAISWRLTPGWELQAGYENSRSRLASATGYRYQGAFLALGGSLRRIRR